jgi:hypothetical protein
MYGYILNRTCVYLCRSVSVTLYGDNITNLCVSKGSCTVSYFTDPGTGLCVLLCSDTYFADPVSL